MNRFFAFCLPVIGEKYSPLHKITFTYHSDPNLQPHLNFYFSFELRNKPILHSEIDLHPNNYFNSQLHPYLYHYADSNFHSYFNPDLYSNFYPLFH